MSDTQKKEKLKSLKNAKIPINHIIHYLGVLNFIIFGKSIEGFTS